MCARRPVGTPPERALGFLMDNLKRLEEGKPLLSVCNGPGHSDGIFDGVEVRTACCVGLVVAITMCSADVRQVAAAARL